MPKAFDFASPPFDRLRPEEAGRVERAVDIVFLRQGQTAVARGTLPGHVFVVIKGLVEERDGGTGEPVAVREAGDLFDASILLHQGSRNDFVVREEAICYRLPVEEFLGLTANNQAFAAYFLEDISHKLEDLARRGAGPPLLGTLTGRIAGAMLDAPVRVPASLGLREAALRMDEAGQHALLVEGDDGRVGIVTGVDLMRAGVRDGRPLDTPVGEVARFDPLAVEEDGFLYEAALVMARARVRHLLVRRGPEIVGVLDAVNALSSLANQAAALGSLIDKAGSVAELADAGERISALVRQLHGSGTKVGFVTAISTELQRRLARRAFGLLAPPGLGERACLIVMGSEGRGESMLPTDQDNGLILAGEEELGGLGGRLTAALAEAGFPLCPGGIMASNPRWAKPAAAFRAALRDAVLAPGEQALMDVAILYDAVPVAGDAGLLEGTKAHLFDLLAENQAFHARFALAIDAFDGQAGGILGGLFSKGPERLDVKKVGIFPLMHGVRALALERRITETNTGRRARLLAADGLFDEAYARQLADAFDVLSGLRLTAALERLRLHREPSNLLDLAPLGKLERDLLRDALRIVRDFKGLVRHHFRLGMF